MSRCTLGMFLGGLVSTLLRLLHWSFSLGCRVLQSKSCLTKDMPQIMPETMLYGHYLSLSCFCGGVADRSANSPLHGPQAGGRRECALRKHGEHVSLNMSKDRCLVSCFERHGSALYLNK